MRKITAFTALALTLLLTLCGCTQPSLYTSDRLEVEVKGENTKTLTLTFTGPDLTIYSAEITELSEEAVYTISSNETEEGATIVELTGAAQGNASLIMEYSDGDEVYVTANLTVAVDKKLKLSVPTVNIIGYERYVSLGEEAPEGSQITKDDGGSKLIKLANADSPWFVEDYDEDILHVEEYGFVEEDEAYEFFVSSVSSGSGSLYLVNESLGLRMTLNFNASNVVEGDTQYLDLVLAGSSNSAYSVKDSTEYAERVTDALAVISEFDPYVFVPHSAIMKGYGTEEGHLEISLEMGDNRIEYLVFKDIALKDELDAVKKELTIVESETFESNGVEVNLFLIDDYAMAVFEKDTLLYEVFILEASDIVKAGDIIEAFLSDEAL